MAKRLNVDLSFSADTKQAEKNIAELSKSLNKIANLSPVEGMSLNKDLQAAVSSAQALQKHLGNAFNVKTGNFDLNRLSQSLKSSNTDLATLTSGLLKAGMQGEQAFMKVQRALSTANVQINKSQSLLSEFATTLKNTARWEISSKVMHGFESAISNAYRYAQDLNKSLTDIRIVTGANADEMARFAVEANNAAKRLSTTTTDYTNASLIYFQQGLSDKEVAERTEVTIKMANAAGVSAQKVSDQMTAVWNNFDDGSKSLEYYADVMTALGAATASSTDEISQGLQKFAAVAETVGLSYEYATAALATVTAETRESADVVGTAYKTLFARIQGLQQGDTLDDGTSLNKYSAALAKVGIDIKDVNGDMKDMDVILNEMGAKWDTLAKDQQLALAQTVAGVRQYTQLVALMDNWDVFQENLNTAYTAEGSLQEQADIYAESWEAAQKRVKASLQEIYSVLIPEDFMINFTSATADVLDGVGDILRGMGGFKTILLMISSIALRQFGPSLGASLQDGINKIGQLNIASKGLSGIWKSISTPQFSNIDALASKLTTIQKSSNDVNTQMNLYNKELEKGASSATKMAQSMIQGALDTGVLTDEFKTYAGDLGKINNLQSMIEQSSKYLTDEQRQQLQLLQEQALAASERHQQEVAIKETLEQQAMSLADSHDFSVYQGDGFKLQEDGSTLEFESSLNATEKLEANIADIFKMWREFHGATDETVISFQKIGDKLGFVITNEEKFLQAHRDSIGLYTKTITLNTRIGAIAKDTTASVEERKKKIVELVDAAKAEYTITEDTAKAYKDAADSLEEGKGISKQLSGAMATAETKAEAFAVATGNGTARMKEAKTVGVELGLAQQKVTDAANQTKNAIDGVANSLRNALASSMSVGNTFVKMASGLSTVAMGMTSISNAAKTFSSDSATGLEKFSAATMAAVAGTNMLMTALKGANTLLAAHKAAQTMVEIANLKQLATTNKLTAAEVANQLVQKLGLTGDKAAAATKEFLAIAQEKGVAAAIAQTIANYGLATSQMAVLWPVLLVVAAIGALVAIIWGAVAAYDALTQSEEEAYERSKQAAEELQKSADDAKEAADKLASAFDNYDSAVDKLEECTKGTEEWKKALEEVNEAALEVIDNLPDDISAEDLDALYDRDKKTGQITLNRDEVAKQQSKLNDRAANADYAAQMAKIHSTEAKITLDTSDLADEMVALQNALAMSDNSGYGAYSGANYVNPEALQKAITENLDELSGLTDSEFKEKLEALGVQTQYLTDDVLAQYQERVNQLADSTEAAEAKMRLIAAIKVEEILGDEYDAPTKDIVTNELADREDELKDAYLGLMTSDAGDAKATTSKATLGYTGATGINKVSEKDNEVYQYILSELQKYGYNWTADTDNPVQGTDANRTLSFRDENGDLTDKNAEWIAETLAAARALGELTGSAEEASNWLGNLDKNASDTTAAGVKNLISEGNFNNLSKNELDTMSAEVGTDPEAIRTYLKNAFGLQDENELMTIFGVDTLGEVSTKWLDAVAATNDDFAKVLEGLPPVLQQAFNKIPGINDLSLEAQNAITGMLFDAVKAGNVEDAAGELTSLLTDIMSDPTVDANELSTILGGIDWQTTNVEELTGILEDAGINTTSFKDKLQELIDLMQEGANVGFDAAAEHYGKTSEIANNIKDGDKFISNEDAEYLKAAGINVEEFFARTADGTWKLLGDAQEFYNIVNNSSLDIFKSNIEALRAEAGSISNLQNNYTQDTIQLKGFEEGYFDESSQNYNKEQIEAQIAYIKAVSDVDTSAWEVALETGSMTLDQLQAIQSTVEENAGAWGNLSETLEMTTEELYAHYDAVAMSAQSLEELNQMLEDGEIDAAAYAKAMETVGAAEAEAFGLDPDEFEDLSEMIEESGSAIAGLSDDLKGNEREANDVAKALLRYDKAVGKVVEKSEDWKKALTSGNLQDQAEAIEELEEAYTDMLDIDLGVLSNQFLKNAKNLDLMTRAANGSEEAYRELQAIAARDILTQVGLDTTLFEQDMAWLQTVLFDDTAFPDLEVGASLDNTDFLNSLTEMINRTAMTVDQATAYLASMGVDAEIVEEKTTAEDKQEQHGFDSSLQRNVAYARYPIRYGEFSFGTYTAPIVTYDEIITPTLTEETATKENTAVALKVTSANKSSGGTFKHKNSSNASGSGKKTGGGGGSKKSEKSPTPAKKQSVSKMSDTTDRYHTVNAQLDDVADAMDKASKAADKLWSKDRLKYLDEQNALLDEEIALLEKKRKEAQDYIAEDKADLERAAANAGFTVAYDENGNITNYRDMMDALARELINAENHMNSLATQEEQDAYEETILKPLREKIKELEAAIALYEESLETAEETDQKIQEALDQKMQNNFDKIIGELEINIAINERDLEILDYYLNKIEDDFYAAAEAAALMVGQLDSSSTMGGQMGEYFQQLKEYSNALDELNAKHAAGEITDAAYEEGLEKIRSGLLDNLEAIQELDKAMLEYYGDTLKMAGEEIDKYVARMEHQTSILEHYGNMMEILGKEMDYEAMGEILQGQVDTIENEMEVAEATYNMYQQQADEKKALLDDAIARGDTAAAEVYQKEWEAANEAAMDAQSEMLDKTEEWAEAMRAVVENKLAGLAKSLEEALTGGTSFDEMTTSIERAASLQEEYLTTTNQIYETNKLMRQAQQEIDKTNNTVAKQRLKDFIVETDQLQEKSKLSQYELEIQQAKYNLLLAEIALEEAQNAKSTVRLQRDSEGNFGYVYTADQDQVAQAQQELEDAQNSLYNIALEGANDYTEKYSETLQEMYDTLTSIQEAWLNGEIATQEEYDRQMLAAQEYYYQKLEDYSSLYTVAVTTDTRVVKDAWSSGFSDMIYKTETWKEAVNTYSNEAKQTLVDWYAKVDEIANKTGLDNIAGKVKAITDESEALKIALLGEDGKSGVIQAIKDELTAVSNLTGGYANLRKEIQALIADYEQMMKTVNNAQNQQTSAAQANSTGNGVGTGTSSNDSNNDTSSKGTSSSGTTGDSTPTGVAGNSPTIAVGQDVTIKSNATHFSRDGGNGTRMRSFVPGSTYSVMDFDDDEVKIGRNGVTTGWVKKTDIVGFNTGGYTGEWGPYGKLAFLDEKELILNEGDTANFLASMELLSHILEMIDLQSATAQLGGLLTTPRYAETMNEVVEQNVHIEASFPAVQDRNEIEEAFNTLINRASQYANRK